MRPRGQAIVETCIMLPLFILVLFGVIWAYREAVIGERVQLGARFAGLITARSAARNDYSIASMYRGGFKDGFDIGGNPTPVPCTSVDSTTTSSLNGYSPINGRGNSTYFTPQNSAVASTCNAGDTGPLVLITDAKLTGGSLLLLHNAEDVSAPIGVPGYLQRIGLFPSGATSLGAHHENFFRTTDIADLLNCYPEVRQVFSVATDALENFPLGGDAAVAAMMPLPTLTNGSVPKTQLVQNVTCSEGSVKFIMGPPQASLFLPGQYGKPPPYTGSGGHSVGQSHS